MGKRHEQEEDQGTLFSVQDLKAFQNKIAAIGIDGRSKYGPYLNWYEMFLISVDAVQWHPNTRTMGVKTYHDDTLQDYVTKHINNDFPMAYDAFLSLSQPTRGTEGSSRVRHMRDRFCPRLFWDALYHAAGKPGNSLTL